MDDQGNPRKRQRDRLNSTTDGNEPSRSKQGSSDGVEAPAAGEPTVPSVEEVEEFFEILRRMQVAMRYFNKKINVEGGGGRLSGTLREVLQMEQVKLGADNGETEAVEEKSHAFDLNSEPDRENADITPEP
ncbi:hypothetical protein MLD38_026216 [Melastoma candidum]|uniref:Uncharacterized protein n=1 Tax=Melastoma candidum TaxID=119954 RepID=A0ACB9P1E1_9MYRT|nr:hypothetical protein MLD38_026216 [Melastoma candidum]